MHQPGSPDAASLLSVRSSADEDSRELARLAKLDSAEPLRGRVLVGRIDGVLRAALSLDEDRVIADPFAPTRALVALLRLRARTLQTSQTSSARIRDRKLVKPTVRSSPRT